MDHLYHKIMQKILESADVTYKMCPAIWMQMVDHS